MSKSIADYVTAIEDYPEKGVIFRDITSVIQHPEGLKMAVDEMIGLIGDTECDLVAGAEARGFIFGASIAYALGKGFIPVRKRGKLPRETVSQSYELEYGTGMIEIHKDSIKPGQRVVLVDDLMATGGTMEAMVKLVESLGGKVAKIIFLLELAGLNGRDKLKDYDVAAVLTYDGK